jgi:antirestriction protein ArdC
VQMPPFECFRDAESYYAALAHEMTHNAGPSVMPRRFEFARKTRSYRRGDSA